MPTGMRTSLTDTTNLPRAISDAVFMIDWKEAPLLNLLGFDASNERKIKVVNWPSTKLEWLEDTMSPLASTLASNVNNGTTTIPVATGTGVYFRQGDIILCESEQMLVTSVSSDNLTVAARGYGGTTAASHNTPAAVTIVTRAMPEGNDVVTGYSTTVTAPYNYVQILSQGVKVSKTDQALARYGIDDEMDYQVAKLFANGGQAGILAQLLAKTFYYGLRVQRSASAYGSMGGFKTFVTTNTSALGGAALQRSDIHAAIRKVRDAGGMVSQIITGSWGIEKVTAMYEGAITMDQDATRGESKNTRILTPHGEVEVVFDWMCPAGEMYLIDRNKMGWLPLRPFKQTNISEQGDYFVTDIVGEFTFFLANEKSHALITGFSTTS